MHLAPKLREYKQFPQVYVITRSRAQLSTTFVQYSHRCLWYFCAPNLRWGSQGQDLYKLFFPITGASKEALLKIGASRSFQSADLRQSLKTVFLLQSQASASDFEEGWMDYRKGSSLQTLPSVFQRWGNGTLIAPDTCGALPYWAWARESVPKACKVQHAVEAIRYDL